MSAAERRRLAVIGHPISHSRSPAMQNAALAALGLADSWSYEALDVEPAELARRLRSMPGEDFVGANVTVPHKVAALALADGASPVARGIGAANTLCFEAGAIRADNTDAAGLIAALPRPASGSRALVLGAGGAARAVVWALVRAGAEVEVWNRTESRARQLCEDLGGSPVLAPDAAAHDLIVNSTAVGLRGEDPFGELPLRAGDLHGGQVVVDMVYGSEPGALLEAAAAAGAETIDGIEVLVRQGAASLEIWTGLEAPVDVMRDAARRG
jgi:shikimate dehydrogenase